MMDIKQLLAHYGKSVHKKKHDHVFLQGDSDDSLYFVQSGLLKAYYTSTEGKEFVKSFITPTDAIGSLAAITQHGATGEGCSFSLLCLEDSVLIKVPFTQVRENSRNDQNMANHMIDLLLKLAMKKEKREFEFLCLTPEERYRQLVQDMPDMVEKVTQNDLAKYLGVTAVGLSRIKKRVTSS